MKNIQNFFNRFKNRNGQTPVILELFFRYNDDNVGMKAAALSYYLIFSIFPMLILLSMLIGSLHIDVASLNGILDKFLPEDMIEVLKSYLVYVTDSYSSTLMSFAIVFSVYFPWRFIKSLMESIRTSFDLGKSTHLLRDLLRQLLCTLLLPLTITLCLILIIFGQNVITWICSFLLRGTVRLSAFLLSLWQVLRFAAAALIMGLSLGILYEASMDKPVKIRELFPGILFSIAAWVLASMIFSFYVENFANYSVIYGAIGGFMVLLLWLYLSGSIFILGSELNAILLKRKHPEDNPENPKHSEIG